ncbi:cysteine--tRNA ligase [Rhodopseudomonas telluris]|uniref:Cysteine--tRNA ligase n=1 Tax=Rhodopseudomonas telluris TaxID=644215 RepID=A0ABV6ESV3_9BRAD
MALRLYDTLTKEKRDFAPIDPSNVRMYVCGPTVYDFAHIGNARPVIVFDVLFRLLRHLYGEAHVKYVRNITDVDDKINDRAACDFPGLPLNEAIRKVTERTESQFHDDVDALGCLRPSVEPRATEHIAEMRQIIEKLVAGGFAYVAADHVLFSPAAMNAANGLLPRYGALANRTLDEMIAGARVDVAPYKRDATDFVLWKPSKPGEPSWPSPAGIAVEGRPGWHIECSAMSWKHLGETFDIHGGGIDLVFPHHENEVAQTCCAFHTSRMAQTWMHNGFLQVEGEKMSKSLGNFVTIRELLEGWKGYSWPGDALRLAMLKTHYRQPLDWTYENLDQTHKFLWDWYLDIEDVAPSSVVPAEIVTPLADDLNTPAVIAGLHVLHKSGRLDELKAALVFLGLSADRARIHRWPMVPLVDAGAFNDANNTVLAAAHRRSLSGTIAAQNADSSVAIQKLVDARTAARANKDWKESDRIRDELAAMGITIKDGKDADGKPVTTWEIAR